MRTRIELLACAGAVGLMLASAGCARDARAKTDTTDPSQVSVERVADPNVIQAAHPESFSLVTVAERPFLDELHVNGSIAPDVSLSVPVLSLASGRAVAIRAQLGDRVSKGQLLLRIDSPEVSSAISTYEQAVADEALARKQLERSQLLLAKGAIAAKDVEVAEDAEEKAKVTLQTAERQMRLLGADPANPSPVIDVKAPISGTIVEQNITGGTAVKSTDNSPNLFTIADLSRVWLLCDVYENNLAQVRVGDRADVRLNAYPERAIEGRVSNIGTVLDPALRSAKVRIEIANPAGLMRVGMFATATFHALSSRMRVYVPATAAIRLHDRDWVFVPLGGNQFRRTAIQVGAADADGTVEVLSGLAAGDKIVGKALQFESAATEQ